MWGRGGRDRNAGARVGGGRMTGGARRGLVSAWFCGWERGDVDDSWAVQEDDKAKLVKKRTF